MEQTIHPTPNPRRARPALMRLLSAVGVLFQMAADPRYRFPAKTKLLVVLSLVYLISPVDLIPDILPVIGFVDDLALLTATGAVLLNHAKEYARLRGIRL